MAGVCKHERLNEDGICRVCGRDCRGIYQEYRYSAEPVCDFCTAPRPTHVIKCRTFEVQSPVAVRGMPRQVSLGAWEACAACNALIDAGDFEGLLRSALAAAFRLVGDEDGEWKRVATVNLRRMYQQFWDNRIK